MARTRLFSALIVLFFSTFYSCKYQDVEVVELKNYHVDSFTEDGFSLALDVEVENPNGYAMKMKSANMDVYLNNTYLGKSTISEKVVLPAKQKSVQHIMLHTTYDETFDGNLMAIAASALFGKSLKLNIVGEIKGSALLISRRVPFSHTEKVNLSDFQLGK